MIKTAKTESARYTATTGGLRNYISFYGSYKRTETQYYRIVTDMRILVINYEYPPLGGGGGTKSMYTAREYAKNHEVYFLTAGFNGDFGISRVNGYTLHKLKTMRRRTCICTNPEMADFVARAWFALNDIFKKQQFDIIHIFFGMPTGFLSFHPQMRKTPFVISAGGSDVPWFNPTRFHLLYHILTPVVKNIWARSGRTIANSAFLRYLILRHSPELDAGVIPNGIDIETFSPAAQPAEPSALLYCGRLVPHKKVDVMIKALALLPEKTRLILAGDGAMRPELEKLAASLGVSGRVQFRGWLDFENMPDLYRSAHIYLQISDVEGMSNSVLQAMACGLPAILSRNASAGYGGGETASFLDEVTPETVAGAAKAYMTDGKLYAKHSANARAYAEKSGWAEVARQYIEEFEAILARRAGTASR